MPEIETKLEKKLRAIDSLVLKEDFTNGFKIILNLLKNAIENLQTKYQQVINRTEIEISAKLNALTEKVNVKLTQVKNGQDGEKGADGRDGVSPSPDSVAVLASKLVIGEVLPKIPTIDAILEKLLTQSDKVVAGLELRIDDIKDLADKLEEIKKIKTTRQLFGGGGFSYIAMDQHFIDDETPTGTPNGVLTTFTLGHAPSPIGSLKVFINGQRMRITEDYTYASSTRIITFLTAPPTGSIILCDYRI